MQNFAIETKIPSNFEAEKMLCLFKKILQK